MTISRTDADSLQLAVDAAKSGDPSALERVVSAVQDDVYRLALRMTACPEDAL